jgi:hypothetical protein
VPEDDAHILLVEQSVDGIRAFLPEDVSFSILNEPQLQLSKKDLPVIDHPNSSPFQLSAMEWGILRL